MLLLLSLADSVQVKKASAQEVSYQVFYDQLSPYGQWVYFPNEGNVWVPAAEPGFSPYQSQGYWAYTDYGWAWVSDYQWGWAPFHYGRWDFDDDYGWYWVPDYEWAPAWVAWSRAPGYYGWAPLRPGVEVDYAITNGYYLPHEHWCYVHEEYLGRRDMNRHFAPRSENLTHIRNSMMINKTYIDNSRHTTYMGGPPREEVEKSTGAPLKQLTIAPRSTPGQSVAANQISIYKPVVVKTTANNQAPSPAKVTSLKDMKPLPGRTPNQERLNASMPPESPVQQTQPRTNPATIPPPIRQNQNTKAAPQTPPQNNRTTEPEQRQQTAPQQTAPRENQTQRTAPKETPQQPPIERAPRYAPPRYNSPKPYNPPPQTPQRTEPAHAAPPQRETPSQQHKEPTHAVPAPKAPPSQQDGKPH